MTASRKQRNDKTSAKKTAGQRANARPKKGERDSLKKLRAHIDNIDKRLSNAQSLTRISVKALDSSYENLSQINQGEPDTHTLRLAEHVDALSAELTQRIEQTRADIAHDLKIVLADPRLETISAAITKANHRLSIAEAGHVKTIDKINSKIAGFTALLETETQSRQSEISDLGGRLDTLETHSTKAITSIGDKIVDVSESLKHSGEKLRLELGEKGLGIAQDLEEHKSGVAMRIEALEDDQRNTIPSIERRLVTLDTRLEMLETAKSEADFRAETKSKAEEVAPPYEAAPHIDPVKDTAPQPSLRAPTPVQTDAFSPSEAVSLQAVTPPENPYNLQSSEQYQQPALGSAQPETFIPQEYNPDEHTSPAATPPINTPTQTQPEYIQTPLQAPTPSHAPFNLDTGAFEQIAESVAPPPFAPETAAPSSQALTNPYSETMVEARPGADISTPKKASKIDRFKQLRRQKTSKPEGKSLSMPMKTTAMMVGVAALGLFAAKTVLPKFVGSNSSPTPQANLTQQTGQTGRNASTQSPPIQSVAAIGDYSDTMKAPDLGQANDGGPSAKALTLESAAAKGEAIAQFQLGLSHLEAGRNGQAVRLIRLAANQNQPAAQYRLGKLYEAGVGVKANPQTAMDLLGKAANGGNRIAMHDLGHYYATGITGTANITKAMDWFREAASRGVLDSQFNLGVLYQGGNGVDKNAVESYIWYAVAGGQGDKVAAQRSQLVAKDLTQEQLALARARIKSFSPKPINEAANGVFKNLPWLTKANATTGHIAENNKIGVKTAQSLLSTLGYNVGKPDGAMGPRTRNAVISFERANGLPETGRINAALLDRLNLAAGV